MYTEIGYILTSLELVLNSFVLSISKIDKKKSMTLACFVISDRETLIGNQVGTYRVFFNDIIIREQLFFNPF